MNVFIRVKAAGKRRDSLQKQPAVLPERIDSPKELITYLVRENVRVYNAKVVDSIDPLQAANQGTANEPDKADESAIPLFRYLSEADLADSADTGKVGFRMRKNEKQQDEEQAVQNALQCYYDGIYRILINDVEMSPHEALLLREEDVITFIRLVMLAGRRW
ncbi:hypothetical protein ACYULU_01135 [Breznakiellaceae bacterium SP9]